MRTGVWRAANSSVSVLTHGVWCGEPCSPPCPRIGTMAACSGQVVEEERIFVIRLQAFVSSSRWCPVRPPRVRERPRLFSFCLFLSKLVAAVGFDSIYHRPYRELKSTRGGGLEAVRGTMVLIRSAEKPSTLSRWYKEVCAAESKHDGMVHRGGRWLQRRDRGQEQSWLPVSYTHLTLPTILLV